MPGLRCLGRRWDVGSDDFLVPSICSIIVQALWGAGLVAVIAVLKPTPCEDSTLHTVYLAGALIICILSVIVSILMAYFTTRGILMDEAPRGNVACTLYMHIFLSIALLAWTAIGSYWVWTRPAVCADLAPSGIDVIRAIVITNWIAIFTQLCGCLTFRDPRGTAGGELTVQHTTTIWRTRINALSCFVTGNGADFTEPAKLMATLLYGVDVVPTDVAAGMFLLNREQVRTGAIQGTPAKVRVDPAAPLLTASNPPTSPGGATGGAGGAGGVGIFTGDGRRTRELDTSRPADHAVLGGLLHFSRFMLAAYGWPLYTFSQIRGTCCNACCAITTCYCCRGVPLHAETRGIPAPIVGDNCCKCNTASMSRQLQNVPGSEVEVLYTSFQNEVYKPAFFVAIDHLRKHLVITVRGSLSLDDALTDILLSPVQLTSPEFDVEHIPARDAFAHGGMVASMRWVVAQLSADAILERYNILGAHKDVPKVHGTGYELHIVGHSLGAATAVLLALHLHKRYPSLRCWAYSTPGVYSPAVARYCDSFVVSLILGYDVIPRLSEQALHLLRADLGKVMAACRSPKHRVLCCGNVSHGHHGDNGCLPDRKAASAQTPRDILVNEAANIGPDGHVSEPEIPPMMLPPGNVLHLLPDLDRPLAGDCFSPCAPRATEFNGTWVDRSVFSTIAVAPSMMFDHFPDNVATVLARVCAELHITPQHMAAFKYADLALPPESSTNTPTAAAGAKEGSGSPNKDPIKVHKSGKRKSGARARAALDDSGSDSSDLSDDGLGTGTGRGAAAAVGVGISSSPQGARVDNVSPSTLSVSTVTVSYVTLTPPPASDADESWVESSAV